MAGVLDKYDHHVIVRDVDYVNNILKLTGFDGPFPEDGTKAKVVTKEIDYADLSGSLYKIKYAQGEALNRGKQFLVLFNLINMRIQCILANVWHSVIYHTVILLF